MDGHGRKGIPVQFGDIMLVTECSKTAAWASAVYSQCSSDFGLTFSVGGAFLPIPNNNLGVTVGSERSGSVQHRRSQRVIGPSDVEGISNDQTIFIKAYRPGLGESFYRSFASTVRRMMVMNRSPKRHQMQDPGSSPSTPSADGSPTSGRQPPGLQPSSSDESEKPAEDFDFVSSLSPECPVRFQPRVIRTHADLFYLFIYSGFPSCCCFACAYDDGQSEVLWLYALFIECVCVTDN